MKNFTKSNSFNSLKLSRTIVLLAIALFFGLSTYAHDFEVDGIYYNIISSEDKTVEVTYKGDFSKEEHSEYKGDVKITESVEYNGIQYSIIAIGNSAFSRCIGLATIEIPNSVTSIGKSTFFNCINLTSIEIPNSVESIGSSAFSLCFGLTSVVIGNSVTSIGEEAFNGCSSLTSIEIPNSVTSIGRETFSGCTGLTSVVWNAVNCKDFEETMDPPFSDCPVASFTFGESVKHIPAYLCYGKGRLSEITIPNSVTSIGSYAFAWCSSLKSLIISNSITLIDSYAFGGCNLVKVIWLSNTPPTGYSKVKGEINYVANDRYKGLNNVKIYPYLSSIFEVDGIKYIPISPSERTCDAIDCICDNRVTDVVVDATVSNMGVEMTVKTVMPYTFYSNNHIKSATINNEGVIGYCAFENCASLVDITLGNNIEYIGDRAFAGCEMIKNIIIPDSTVGIGKDCFRDCSSLQSVVIGQNVEQLLECTFANCISLPEITIPKSLMSIGNNAFMGCTSLADVVISDRETELSLGSNASSPLFANCPLDSVYIGGKIVYDSSSKCGYSPFYRNKSLQTVKITDKETEIYDNEFYGCSNLKNVTIGNGVNKIGNWAFSGCSNLDYFAFGLNVETIGEEAFSDCINVSQIISYNVTPPVCGTQALDDINKWTCTLKVPGEAVSRYQSAEQWKEFFFIEAVSSVNKIENQDFLIKVDGNNIVVCDAQIGETVRVFAADGSLVAAKEVMNSETTITVSASGMYIVAVGKQAKKVMIK